MFSGIIKDMGIIKKIVSSTKGLHIGVKSKLRFSNRDLGSSINCSGVCLTLEKISRGLLFFYLSKETLEISNFKNIKINHKINLERSLKFSNRMSGHFVQGHVDTISKLKKKKFMVNLGICIFQSIKILKNFLLIKAQLQ